MQMLKNLSEEDPNNSLHVPLHNLSQLNTQMDSVQTFISQTIHTNTLLTNQHMHALSNEILSALHDAIINASALLAQTLLPPTNPKLEVVGGCNIMELDASELLLRASTHSHFCEVCGKGFTRDANLRMHMRAHGDQFKTPQALAKKTSGGTCVKATRFSCPFEGCRQNKRHEKFRPLKSVACLRNHFKRSHCPKTYTCQRCQKKSFAMVSDLRSHAKQCRGESTRGTTFSRKEESFGHTKLFEGILPELPEGFFDDLDEYGF